MVNQDNLIRPEGAARRAGVSTATIRRWIREGKLRKYTDARKRVWVDGTQVDAMNTVRPAEAPAVTGVGA
jgi:excisionase family DNA binding protein